MSKNKSKSKSKSKVNKVNAIRGRGRPAYQTKWPIGKFTLTDLMVLNGVNPETGKGKFCSKLTLIKGLERDRNFKGNSIIVKTEETRKPISESGLGRKCFVYVRRSKLNKATKHKDNEQTPALLEPVSVPLGHVVAISVEIPAVVSNEPVVIQPEVDTAVEAPETELVAS